MRLFIAIELPDHLKHALGRLRCDITGARWAALEQIHLTLAFLGEVDEKTAELLIGELAAIRADAFSLSLGGCGCFPNLHHPRVLWVGVEPEPALLRLAVMIDAALLACDIPREKRQFSPHITLARLKLPCSGVVGAFLDQHRGVKFKAVPVTEFTLFQSRLTQKGALHIPLRNFPLAVAAIHN